MINNFLFYFLITPVVVSIIALNSLFFVHKSPSTPIFENALKHCKSVDNNFVYSDQGTAQDICIDEYMNAPWSVELVIKIFLLFGFIFLVPLLLYIKNR